MAEETLVVEPAEILRRTGLTDAHTDDVLDAITDAQADVQGHIKRPLFPVARLVTGLIAADAFALDDIRAWPQVTSQEDYSVTAYVARPDGLFDVTFSVGFDARKHPSIKRYVIAHAIEMLRANPRLEKVMRKPIRSVSAEGQSLTFDTGSTAEGSVGVAPNLKSLDQFRQIVAYRPNHLYPNVVMLWPY